MNKIVSMLNLEEDNIELKNFLFIYFNNLFTRYSSYYPDHGLKCTNPLTSNFIDDYKRNILKPDHIDEFKKFKFYFDLLILRNFKFFSTNIKFDFGEQLTGIENDSIRNYIASIIRNENPHCLTAKILEKHNALQQITA